MDKVIFLQDSLILLISAIFVVTIVRQLKISSVLGYLLAGILIGPFALGLFQETESTKNLAELGVVFLMFTIGLSLPLDRLKSIGRYAFGLGGLQVLLTTALASFIAIKIGFSFEQSIIIGGGLAFSSTAVVMQLLSESGKIAARFGRVSFAVLLFQDLAVIAFIMMIPLLGNKEASFINILTPILARAALLLLSIIIIGRLLLRPVFRVIVSSRTPELFTAMAILVVFITALATSKMGFSAEMGAFVAGTLLAGSEYRHQVQADIEPFRGLLLGLFFMTVGMSIDLSLLARDFPTILSVTLGLILGKGLILFVLAPLFGLNIQSTLRMAFLLAAGGEFVFILSPLAEGTHLLDHQTCQMLSICIALSMALTPLLFILGTMLANRMSPEMDIHLESASNETKDLTDHVIIGGYSRVGKILAKILSERLIPFIVLDTNMSRVAEGRAKGLPVFFGDVGRLEVLRTAGASHARMALVGVDHPKSSARIVHIFRKNFPHVTVCVQARDKDQGNKLEQLGAFAIIPDMIEPSLKAAKTILQAYGSSLEEADKIIEIYRPAPPPKEGPSEESSEETSQLL